MSLRSKSQGSSVGHGNGTVAASTEEGEQERDGSNQELVIPEVPTVTATSPTLDSFDPYRTSSVLRRASTPPASDIHLVSPQGSPQTSLKTDEMGTGNDENGLTVDDVVAMFMALPDNSDSESEAPPATAAPPTVDCSSFKTDDRDDEGGTSTGTKPNGKSNSVLGSKRSANSKGNRQQPAKKRKPMEEQ
jgi:hypothetical protein